MKKQVISKFVRLGRQGVITPFSLICLVIVLLSPFRSAVCQIHPLSDHYSLNLYQLNPAVAGTERYAPLTFNTHQQWLGWEGAPAAQSLTFHTRLRAKGLFFTPQGFRNKGKNSFGKVGLGGGLFNYSYGSVSHTGIHLDYAYHVITRNGRLAFGLAPTFYQYRLNKSGNLVFPDPNTPDEELNGSNESALFVDFNAGVHYYGKEGYAGLSMIQLLGSAIRFGQYKFPENEGPSLNPDLASTVYAYGGYFFPINRDMKIEAMLLGKYNFQSGFRFDIHTAFLLKEILQTGLGYRWKEGFTVQAGIRLDNLEIFYLFEIPLTSKVPAGFTSHMIQVRFYLGQPIE